MNKLLQIALIAFGCATITVSNPIHAQSERWSKNFLNPIASHIKKIKDIIEINQADGISESIYVSQRCWGLLFYLGTSLEQANPELSKQLLSLSSKSLTAGASFSAAYERQTGQKQSIEAYERVMQSMAKNYTDWANDNYLSSGQNTSPNMQADLRSCSEFLSLF